MSKLYKLSMSQSHQKAHVSEYDSELHGVGSQIRFNILLWDTGRPGKTSHIFFKWARKPVFVTCARHIFSVSQINPPNMR